LPPDGQPTLDNELLRLLRQDPEKRIRDAAINGIASLRDRVWASELLDLIRAGRDRQPNEWVAECYRYGRALAAIGDDETLNRLREFASDPAIPPNVRNWLQSVENALDEHWKSVMRNWPEPTLPWAGVMEEVQTPFALDERHMESARLILWRQGATDPSGVSSWGGSFVEPPGFQSLRHITEVSVKPRSLRISGRVDAQIWIGSVGTHGLVSFVGNGSYPEPLTPVNQPNGGER
jgi:hypothetical protein